MRVLSDASATRTAHGSRTRTLTRRTVDEALLYRASGYTSPYIRGELEL